MHALLVGMKNQQVHKQCCKNNMQSSCFIILYLLSRPPFLNLFVAAMFAEMLVRLRFTPGLT